MTRIASFAHNQLTLSQTLNSQRQILDLQVQISTGKRSQDYASIASDAFRLVSLEGANVRANQYQQNIQQVDRRLQVMETTVSQVFDVASRFQQTLLSALNGEGTVQLDTANEAAIARTQVTGMLNVQYEGRYLFSGSRTDSEPIDPDGWTLPPSPLTPPLATYTDEYYRGDDVMLAVEADKALTIDYGMTAAEPAFEYVMRAMYYVEKAGVPADTEVLNTALALINSAIGTNGGDAAAGAPTLDRDLADIRSHIGTTRKTLEETTGRLTDLKLYLDENIGDLENVDVPAAVSQLTVQQTLLEASFATLSRLSQLTLVQYL